MKPAKYILFSLLLSGCLGDAALPRVSSTVLPKTQVFVDLGGPDRQGNYHYYVHMPDGSYVHRLLGVSRDGILSPANVEILSDGVYRIQWGTASSSFFAVIDVAESVIVEDSNASNPKRESLNRRN